MTEEFKIIPPKKTQVDDVNDRIPSILMPLNFRTIIYGSSASGKGVLLNNLLSNRSIYSHIFGKNIFIFSTTFNLGDPSLSDVQVEQDNVFNNLDEDMIRSLIQEQKDNIKEFGKDKVPYVLVVLDDVLSQMSHKRNSILREMFYSGRHIKFNFLILVQSYRGVVKPMRTNSTHSIFFGIENGKERQAIVEEQNAPAKIMEEILDDATRDKFSFLVVNHKTPDKNKRFQKRFSNHYYNLDVKKITN
jgi:hypothetical protein